MGATAEQVEWLIKRSQVCFTLAHGQAQSYPPPGRNAANGWLPVTWVKNPSLLALEKASTTSVAGHPGMKLTGEAEKLYSIMARLFQRVRQGINKPNYYSNALRNANLFWAFTKEFGSEIGELFRAVMACFDEDEKCKKLLSEAIVALMNKVKSTKLIVDGKHANGHIATGVQRAGQITLRELQKNFGPVEPVAEILRVVCKGLIKANEGISKNHTPWLRPEWWVVFTATLKTASEMLKKETQVKYHQVQENETLSKIALKYYKDANLYPRIFSANRHLVRDPDQIHIGQVVRILPKSKL